MALPAAIAKKVARQIYRDAKGRFISKSKAALLARKDPATGRFLSAAKAAKIPDKRKVENFLRAQLGAPPAGKNWVQIASKYAERFADYLQDID